MVSISFQYAPGLNVPPMLAEEHNGTTRTRSAYLQKRTARERRGQLWPGNTT